MKLRDIIKLASDSYSDDLILQYYEYPDEDHGDGLARFIALELQETYDEDATTQEQIAEAYRVMENAWHQIEDVMVAFEINMED